jgi:Flp pilus assembly pilin Flp
MKQQKIRRPKGTELGATIVDYCVLVAFVSAMVASGARLMGIQFNCIFGGAAYGLTGVNLSGEELRRNVPADMIGPEAVGRCSSLN